MHEIVPCPSCGRRLRFREDYLEKLVQCPACGTRFRPADAAPAPPPPPRETPRPDPDPVADAPEPEPEEFPEEQGEDNPAPPRRRIVRVRPRRASRERPFRKQGNPLKAVAVICVVIGFIALYFVSLLWQFGAPAREQGVRLPQALPGDDRQLDARRQQEIIQAFQNQKPLTEKEIADELKPLFQGLRDAHRARDQDRLVAFFDVDRLFDEMVALDLLPPAVRQQRDTFLRGARQGVGAALARNDALMGWKDFEIKHVRKLQGNEAVVILRHRIAGGSVKIRWWVTKRQGDWRVFDLEDLDMGMRVSSSVGAVAAMGPNNPDALLVTHLGQAIQAAIKQDPGGAERHLRQVADARFPAQLEAVRFLATALVHFQRGQNEEAMKALEKAHGFNPNMPGLDLLKGLGYNRLGQWDKALTHLDKYRALLGEDAAVNRELGEALRGVRRFPEACAAYRKSLDEEPKDLDAFLGLLRAVGPGEPADDVGPRFLKLGATRANFDVCADDCRQGRDGPMLERLARVMKTTDPDYAPADYYLALARAWAGRAGEAVPLFRAALAKQRDQARRQEYVAGFAQAMTAAGKTAEAYAALPDAREAFRTLAAELKKAFRDEELRRLVAAHAKKDPGDPRLPFYRGEVYAREGKYALAEQAFAAGLAKPPDAVTADQFRASRVLARYHTGKALSAYADIGPRHETFSQLVELCFQDANYPQLEALLDAHAKNYPDNAEVLRHRGRLAVRRGRLEEGAKLLRSALAKLTRPEDRKQALTNFLLDTVDAGKPLEGYRAAPDAREAFRILAQDLLGTAPGRQKELKALLEAHRLGHPDDVWLTFYQGESFIDDWDYDKAARALGEVWKNGPPDLRRRARSSYVFALYKTGRGNQAYEELGRTKEAFNQLANLMAQDKKGKELAALATAHRPHAGDDPDLSFYEARAKVFLSRPAEAAPLLQEACRKQPAEQRRKYYVNEYVLDMEKSGWGLEAYRATPDKVAAFNTLARTLTAKKKTEALEALVREHGKSHAADAWSHFYAGELHLLRGEAKQAGKEFAASLARVLPPNDWTFRHGLYRARVKAGEAAKTYQEFGPGERAFGDLASLCLAEKDAGQLEALLAAHRKTDPEDPNLVAWELDVRWLKQDYRGALELLDGRREDVFSLPNHRWKGDSYRVRCLVKLGRADEAVREADAMMKTKQGNRVLLVLAHAARGDVKQALAALEGQPANAFLVADCYRDPDLGPILRGEPFAAFRARYPEPKTGGRNGLP